MVVLGQLHICFMLIQVPAAAMRSKVKCLLEEFDSSVGGVDSDY